VPTVVVPQPRVMYFSKVLNPLHTISCSKQFTLTCGSVVCDLCATVGDSVTCVLVNLFAMRRGQRFKPILVSPASSLPCSFRTFANISISLSRDPASLPLLAFDRAGPWIQLKLQLQRAVSRSRSNHT